MTLHGLVEAQARAQPGRGRRRVRGRAADLPRAERAGRRGRASPVRARRRTGDAGRGLRRALAGAAGRAARRPQGRRGLSAAGSGVPGRPARLHARGRGARRSCSRRKACAAAAADAATVLALDDQAGWPARARPDGGRGGRPRVRDLHLRFDRAAEGRASNTHARSSTGCDWMQAPLPARRRTTSCCRRPRPASTCRCGSSSGRCWPARGWCWRGPAGTGTPRICGDLIRAQGVTTAHFVPSMLGVVPGRGGRRGSRRRPMPGAAPDHLQRRGAARPSWRPAACDRCRGASCTTSTARPRRRSTSRPGSAPDGTGRPARVPIGGPIAEHRRATSSTALRPVPVGVPGELYLGGVGLARGYLRPPGADRRAVRARPVRRRRARGCTAPATWRAGARTAPLEFLGRDRPPGQDARPPDRARRDRGGAARAARRRRRRGVVREDVPGDRRLVAYVVGDARAHAPALRAALKRRLPDYMVPSAFIALDALPLLAQRQARPARAAGPAARPRRDRAVHRAAARIEATVRRSGPRCCGSSGSASTTTSSTSAATRCWPRR